MKTKPRIFLPRLLRTTFFLFAFAGLTLLLTGCATMDARDASRGGDELPWNSPADWEAGSFGVPY
jgi:hypothetical protein